MLKALVDEGKPPGLIGYRGIARILLEDRAINGFPAWFNTLGQQALVGPLTAAIRTAEQPRLASKGDAAQPPFGRVVAQIDPAVVEEAGERAPALGHVAQ